MNATEQIDVPSCSTTTAKSFRPSNKRKKHNKEIKQWLEDDRNVRNVIVKDQTQCPDDDIDLFFKSIAMSVKKLRPTLINEAKMKSLQMIFDLERRNSN